MFEGRTAEAGTAAVTRTSARTSTTTVFAAAATTTTTTTITAAAAVSMTSNAICCGYTCTFTITNINTIYIINAIDTRVTCTIR